MINALLKCIKCSDIFRSHHDLNNHVKNDHQSSIKIKFQNDGVIEVKKTKDNTFKCKFRVGKEPSQLGEHHERAEPSRAEQGVGSARGSRKFCSIHFETIITKMLHLYATTFHIIK